MDRLKLAKSLAQTYHKNLYDGMGYMYHLNSVYENFLLFCRLNKLSSEYGYICYLHDILEDTDIKESYLEHFFGKEILNIIKSLTRNKGEKYNDYVQRLLKEDDIVVIIKLCDTLHNYNYSVDKGDGRRIKKYESKLEIYNKYFFEKNYNPIMIGVV